MKEECNNCKYYKNWACHIKAPVYTPDDNCRVAFPQTYPESWCREWEDKDNKEKVE